VTEAECWQQLEDAFRRREWTRAAILADALQECGQEELADTVRWTVKYVDDLTLGHSSTSWNFLLPTGSSFAGFFSRQPTLREAVIEIHEHRLKQIAFFST
jgi:hypothetical protein